MTDKTTETTKPAYYKVRVRGGQAEVDALHVIEELEMNFSVGNALKYLWRCGKKTHDPLPDLLKAREYLDREIARLIRGE